MRFPWREALWAQPGARRLPGTGLGKRRLGGPEAGQEGEVVGDDRRPDVGLEVREATPCGARQAIGALEAGDASLDAGAEVAQLAIDPVALDHVLDRQAALLVEGDIGDAPGLG